MIGSMYERCKKEGIYIIENNATVRQVAEKMNLSKTTVHTDITKRLKEINPMLAKQVAVVLAENKAARHIRGGDATKRKFEALRNKTP